MDDLRLVQDLHGLAYDGWSRREEEGCCNGGTLAVVEVLSRLRRSKNNETGFIRSIYSDGLSLWKGKEGGDRLWKSFLRLGRLRVTYLDIQSSMQLGLWLYAYHDRTTASRCDTGPASSLAPCLSTTPSLEALVMPSG